MSWVERSFFFFQISLKNAMKLAEGSSSLHAFFTCLKFYLKCKFMPYLIYLIELTKEAGGIYSDQTVHSVQSNLHLYRPQKKKKTCFYALIYLKHQYFPVACLPSPVKLA